MSILFVKSCQGFHDFVKKFIPSPEFSILVELKLIGFDAKSTELCIISQAWISFISFPTLKP